MDYNNEPSEPEWTRKSYHSLRRTYVTTRNTKNIPELLRRRLTTDLVAHLLEAADPEIELALVILLYTGVRVSEATLHKSHPINPILAAKNCKNGSANTTTN